MEFDKKLAAELVDEKLVDLTFSAEEIEKKLKWKRSREFLLEGQMYDIVRQAQHGDSITYTCYRDHKETRLNIEKKKLIARALGQDPVRKQQNEKIINFFSNLFLKETQIWNNIFSAPSLAHYASNIKHYALVIIPPPSPPPECV
jgi:hypothetical protein